MTRTASPSPKAATDPVLQTATIELYAKRKSKLLERLADAYFAEAPVFHGKIREGLNSGDLESVKLNAHALKSCSFNMGAVRLGNLCQDIESSAGYGDHIRLEILLEKLGPCCFDVEQELRSALLLYAGSPSASQTPVNA